MVGHSFDNYLGMLGKGDGFELTNGLPSATNPSVAGVPVRVRHAASTVQQARAPSNDWLSSHLQWAQGLLSGFVTSIEQAIPGADTAAGMRYWTRADLPFWYELADTFALADRWFASCLGGTLPNLRFLIAGTAHGVTDEIRTTGKLPPGGTIFRTLSRHRVSWTIYRSVPPPDPSRFLKLGYQLTTVPVTVLKPFARNVAEWLYWQGLGGSWLVRAAAWGRGIADLYPMGLMSRQRHLRLISGFLEDAQAGSLPAVSFVEPDYRQNSGEAPQDIKQAEAFVGQVVRAVTSSPSWPETLLLILHDSHGGYYDHVSPPPAPDPDTGSRARPPRAPALARLVPAALALPSAPPDFTRLGFRVPAVLVSPYAKPGYVSSMVYDHTSALKLIQHQWNLPALTDRDAAAQAPLDMLDLAGPPALLDPPDLPYPEADVMPAPPAPASLSIRNGRDFGLRCLQVAAYCLAGYWAFSIGNRWIEALVVYSVALLTVRMVIVTGFWRQWAFWDRGRRHDANAGADPAADGPAWSAGGTRIELYRTVLALAVTTMFVTLISAELYLHGPVRVRPHVFEPVTIRFLQAYTWNLVDSVPGLELTRTFNWTEPLVFLDPWSRAMLVLYRLLILAPVIEFFRRTFTGSADGTAAARRRGR
jgi:phospholipase C